jgi:4-amino-4-deoxy-L-arabinose transferase-like glycosyltransferase
MSGMRLVQCPTVRRPLLTLCALAALTFVLGLGHAAITDADEAYYAEAAREMVASGDWLTPRYNFTNRWQKPVLYYWLTAAIYRITGPTEGSARLWSALSGVGLALVTFAAARRHRTPNGTRAAGVDADNVGTDRADPDADTAAWLAGAIVATSFGYAAMARSALPDLPLAFCITATIAAVLRAVDHQQLWPWAAAGVAAGCGFLMKGPVALAVPAVVLLPLWWLERRSARVSPTGALLAGGLAAAIGLPWYVAMTATHGMPYLESFFVADNLERFTTARFNDPRPVWFYPAVIVGGMMPWSTFALGPLVSSVRAVLRGTWTLSTIERRLMVWAVVPLLLFMASVGQQPRYVLPILPPLAILLASAIATRVRHTPSALAGPTWLTAALFVVLAAALLRLRPMLITAPSWGPVVGAVLLAAAAVALAVTAATGRYARVVLTMTACAALLVLTLQFGALAGRRPEAVESIAAAVRAHRLNAEPVGSYRVFVRNLVFYTGIRQEDLFDQTAVVQLLQSSGRVLVVVPLEELARLEQAAGVRTRELARVTYLNTANLRLDALVNPSPQSQLESVVLVTNR